MEGAQQQEEYDSALAWFTNFQLASIVRNRVVPEWFHGLISRKIAEDLLVCKPVGHFLIRVSESRIGYTLSYRGKECCRHFMIDVLKDGQYNIIGEKINHRSLQDLVEFHHQVPIKPYNDLLTFACEKGEASMDTLLTTVVGSSFPDSKNCFQTAGCATVPAHSGPSRLYPCIETEIAAMNFQGSSLGDTGKPAVPPKMQLSSISSQLPKLPPRGFLSHGNSETSAGNIIPSEPNSMCAETLSADSSQQSGAPVPHQKRNKAIISIINFKKKHIMKRSKSEEHTYSEIFMKHETVPDHLSFPAVENENGNAERSTENVYQELLEGSLVPEVSRDSVHTADLSVFSAEQRLPTEYLHPPPFAPGY
ncbi:hematopoietic SH2 domain-containing protein homolog [Scleropages formosus]|uniref:Hematopoietic SH2 domain containing n=1 Tax=Scleropages formosus TaxID=113540 RepID=A0A8C9S6F7_SCLFO|nr:hematopoietic SH2 domain-containing protein homolog [Scleropages formosus]XP_029110852.1 hematopoietic SH2 domain-containing protein homolog [Scleropages formosus]